MSLPFVHLRVHSQYSIGLGTLFIKKIPDLCKKFNMAAVAITDTNLMAGTPEFSEKIAKAGIQPIIGIEVSLNHHNADPRQLRVNQMSRVVLLAQNHAGYLNLTALNSMQYMRDDNRHLGPYLTFDELAAHADGLICLSGGADGPIGTAVLDNTAPLARQYSERFLQIFGDRFYMEISRFGLESQIKTEPEFLNIARELNIPIVATNDVCFGAPDNYEAADAYSCVLAQTKILDPDRARNNSEQYFKSAEEMAEIFNDLPEAIENTSVIATRCAFMVNTHMAPLLPLFGDDFDAECKLLRDRGIEGLNRYLKTQKFDDAEKQKYYDQLNFELDTVIRMRFPGYLLIVADYIDWCNKNDILVGPGRGSAAGSLLCFALGITKANPLKYGLLFERFLNPDRISMPDIDTDFEPAGIARVLKYIQDRYGEDRICRVITFGTLAARGAVRDIGRVYGVPYSKTDRLAKVIPMEAKTLRDAVKKSPDASEMMEREPDLDKVVSVAMEVEGAVRNLGKHACGVIIGDRPNTDITPLYKDADGDMPVCQFDGHYLESAGLIKFDFLGLETLKILRAAVDLIRENRGVNIRLEEIPKDDEKTYKLWRSGNSIGIFQFDAPHVQAILRRMKPTAFTDIVALNALNRPGPLAYIPQYISRKNGDEKVEYAHPLAESILAETFGIITYQEQVMSLSKILAGFTPGMADTLRKGMGKKIQKVMDEMRVKFVDGCVELKTLSRADADEMYDKFAKFAEYAFNKSHALCYAVIANQCAYLKANYTPEFFAASMSSNMSSSEQLSLHIDEAKLSFGLDVLPPDVNVSEPSFSVRDGKVVFGLAAIKGCGFSATEQIAAERAAHGKFKNITDFAKRCAPFINKRILESFARVGAFDSIHPNRAQLYMNTDLIVNFAAKSREPITTLSLFADTAQNDVAVNQLAKNMTRVAAWDIGETLSNEHSILGFYISSHPMTQYKTMIARAGLTTSQTVGKLRDRQTVQIAASVNGFSRRLTKTGKMMMSITASDMFGNIDVVAFGDTVSEIHPIIADNKLILISGRASVRDDNISIFVDAVKPLSEWVASITKKVRITTRSREAVMGVKRILDNRELGGAQITIWAHENGKVVKIDYPRNLNLTADTTAALTALGVDVEME